MIRHLKVERFKCHISQELEFRPLVVLTGLNGSGKTSIIQALLLAQQASVGEGVVALNGPFGLALGEAMDVLTTSAGPEQGIVVSIEDTEGHHFLWRFGVGATDERRAYLDVVEPRGQVPKWLSDHGLRFAYLSAERLGPRDVLEISSDAVERLGVGHQGEYTAQVLASPRRIEISERRRCSGSGPLIDLLHQTEGWMGEIVKRVEIEAQWHPNTSVASLRFKTPANRFDPTRPANMGFGVSYALPLIVAGLLVERGGILIVENPEAHLHPAGQSAMGSFLARVASDGVQVVVETHSDHVLNWIRRAVRNQTVPPDDVSILFFGDEAVERLKVYPSGGIDPRPPGFFDQLEKDLMEFF